MPHIIVKLWPGRTEDQKVELTARIVETVSSVLDVEIKTISVGFEEVTAEAWPKAVYQPDIVDKENTLYKKPGYPSPVGL